MEIQNITFDSGDDGYFDIEREYYLEHEDFEVSRIYDSASQPIMYFIAESHYKKVIVTLIK